MSNTQCIYGLHSSRHQCQLASLSKVFTSLLILVSALLTFYFNSTLYFSSSLDAVFFHSLCLSVSHYIFMDLLMLILLRTLVLDNVLYFHSIKIILFYSFLCPKISISAIIHFFVVLNLFLLIYLCF